MERRISEESQINNEPTMENESIIVICIVLVKALYPVLCNDTPKDQILNVIVMYCKLSTSKSLTLTKWTYD